MEGKLCLCLFCFISGAVTYSRSSLGNKAANRRGVKIAGCRPCCLLLTEMQQPLTGAQSLTSSNREPRCDYTTVLEISLLLSKISRGGEKGRRKEKIKTDQDIIYICMYKFPKTDVNIMYDKHIWIEKEKHNVAVCVSILSTWTCNGS